MTIKYVGPKPTITQHGVSFDTNKEDKYVYLNIVVQLIKALDHEYIPNKSYVYDKPERLSDDEIIQILRKYCDNLDALLDKTNHNVEDEIEENKQRAYESNTLSEEEKKTLINNLNIMRDYMLQRAVNKAVYYCAMDVLTKIVERDHIDHITTPMYQKYVHVLHSLQGTLREDKHPIDTEMSFFEKDNKLFVTLKVVNILDKK